MTCPAHKHKRKAQRTGADSEEFAPSSVFGLLSTSACYSGSMQPVRIFQLGGGSFVATLTTTSTHTAAKVDERECRYQVFGRADTHFNDESNDSGIGPVSLAVALAVALVATVAAETREMLICVCRFLQVPIELWLLTSLQEYYTSLIEHSFMHSPSIDQYEISLRELIAY